MGEPDEVVLGDLIEPEHQLLGAEEAQRAALEYLRRGWAVTAGPGLDLSGTCACKLGAKCRNPGKHALPGWGNETRTTASAESAERHWSPENKKWARGPVDQVFIVPYLSGLIVADVDRQDIWDGLADEGWDTPETLYVKSGSGRGGHYFYSFEWDTREKIPPIVAGKLPGGAGEIKFRGIVVAPPCLHKSGGRYTWANWGTPIAKAPDWMTKEPASSVEAARSWGTIVGADKSNNWINLMFISEASDLDSFGDVRTSRPVALFAIAAGMAKWIAADYITEDEVIDRLLTSAESNGTLDDYGSSELTRQIKNGIQAGMMEKRD
jgi:hypothetical protein